MINIARNFLIMLKNLQQIYLKLLQKELLKKQQKQLVIWFVIKLLIELQKFQKFSQRVTNEHDKEIPKERYISPEGRQKIVDNVRSIIIV